MATVALAVRVRDEYREVEGGDYARASGEAVATFPLASATWGVVRAYAIATGREPPEWVPLAAPLLVVAGQRVAFDLATAALREALADEASAQQPGEATSVLGPPRRPGRGPTFANWRRGG